MSTREAKSLIPIAFKTFSHLEVSPLNMGREEYCSAPVTPLKVGDYLSLGYFVGRPFQGYDIVPVQKDDADFEPQIKTLERVSKFDARIETAFPKTGFSRRYESDSCPFLAECTDASDPPRVIYSELQLERSLVLQVIPTHVAGRPVGECIYVQVLICGQKWWTVFDSYFTEPRYARGVVPAVVNQGIYAMAYLHRPT